MYIIEENLGIEEERATHGGKSFHGFIPPFEINILQRLILDYPITGYVVMEILIVVGSMVCHNWGG